ncbi:hypothetical protein [Nostoc sp.]
MSHQVLPTQVYQQHVEPQAKALEQVYRLQADIAGAKLEDINSC